MTERQWTKYHTVIILEESAKEAAELWYKFLSNSNKFDATTARRSRAKTHIPKDRSPQSALTYKEFDEAVSRMSSNNKVVGPDGIPVEAIKHYPQIKRVMYEIINSMWTQETIPSDFVIAKFVILYKKGSPNDPANYRCIALLNHAFKVLSQIMMMARVTTQCDHFLQD